MKQISPNARKLLDLAPACMVEAAAIAMRHYNAVGDDARVMVKDDDSPLTLADLEVDALIGRFLLEHFPDIAVVTEERAASHEQRLSDGMFFLVDPIDGTKEFVQSPPAPAANREGDDNARFRIYRSTLFPAFCRYSGDRQNHAGIRARRRLHARPVAAGLRAYRADSSVSHSRLFVMPRR